ncbi:hypothetical protein [Streptomyces sp. NPDC054854]
MNQLRVSSTVSTRISSALPGRCGKNRSAFQLRWHVGSSSTSRRRPSTTGMASGSPFVPDPLAVRGKELEGAGRNGLGASLRGLGIGGQADALRRRHSAGYVAAADQDVGEQRVRLEVVPDAADAYLEPCPGRPVQYHEVLVVQDCQRVGEAFQVVPLQARKLAAGRKDRGWIATKTDKGGFYKLTSHGLNGAFHLDVLCAKDR